MIKECVNTGELGTTAACGGHNIISALISVAKSLWMQTISDKNLISDY